MNWETYKTLNKKQKEEYNFKFKDRPITIDGGRIFLYLIVFLSLVASNMISIYLILVDDKFIELRSMIVDILRGTSKLLLVGLGIVLIAVIVELFYIVYKAIDKYRWCKSNNIPFKKVIEWPWTKWKKN
jgi:hypothetical protein